MRTLPTLPEINRPMIDARGLTPCFNIIGVDWSFTIPKSYWKNAEPDRTCSLALGLEGAESTNAIVGR